MALTVLNEDGETVLEQTRDAASLVWPANQAVLAPGRYVWKLVATTAARRITATMAFARLDEVASVRYRKGLEAIKTRGGPDGALLAAHWAARFGLWGEARRLLQDAEDGPLVRETRDWVRAHLGG